MRRILWLGLVFAACDKLPTVRQRPELQAFRASPDVWSGSEVTITSQGFTTAAALPVVVLDDQLLAVRLVDDTTIAAALPDRPGPHALRVVADAVDPNAVTVQLRGFVSRTEGPLLSGRTEPGLDTRYLFGSGPTGLRRWNIRTNKAIDLGDTLHAVACTTGVGPGPAVGNLVLESGGCDSGRWVVWHTEPLFPLADTAAATTDHFVAVLRAGVWVVAGSVAFSVTACDSTCASESIPATLAIDIVRSPRADRAALLSRTIGDGAAPGVPVVDVALGRMGYRVATLSAAQGGAFSSGGDTLYLAGDSASSFVLVATAAADGQLLASRPLGFAPCAVVLDPSRPWVYVAGVSPTSGQSLLQVFDRGTMNPITTLHVTSDIPYGHNLCRIMPNPVEHRVYVAETWGGEHNPTAHAQLYAFETPP